MEMLWRLVLEEEEMVDMLQPLGPPLNRRISQSLEANLSGIPPSISLASRVGEWGRVSLLQCPALTSSSRRRLGCVSMAAGVRRTGSGLGPHPGLHCYMAGAVMVSPDTAARCSPVHAEHVSCSLIN